VLLLRSMAPKNHSSANVQVRGQDDGCCGVFFLKYFLYIFNFIFLLSGLGLLAVALFTLYRTHYYVYILGGHFGAYAISNYLLLGTGGLIVLLIFVLGCCATCNKNRCCLITYSIFLMLVFLAEVGAGVLAYMYELTLASELSRRLSDAMHHYADDRVKWSIDSLQIYNRCCGLSSYEDWSKVPWSDVSFSNGTSAVPDSCCISPNPHCGLNTGPSNINTNGCLTLLEPLLEDHLIVIGGAGLGLCCLQIFGVIFACCLASKIRRWKVRENSYWE